MPFPRNFHATVKSIVRRLFRVYAHLYNHHFAQLCALSIDGVLLRPLLHSTPDDGVLLAHINTSYRHFLLFVTEVSVCLSARITILMPRPIVQFNLMEKKELQPMDSLNESILSS